MSGHRTEIRSLGGRMAKAAKTTGGPVSGTEKLGESLGRDRRKALVERRMMEKACILFAEKGYAGTSLTDVADAVGLTRGAVYYYFKNKEALLEAIVQEVTLRPLEDIVAWRKTAPGEPTARLRAFIRMRVLGVLQRPIQMRMIEVTEAALPPDLLSRHNAAKRDILVEYRTLVRDGILSGDFRPVDDRIAALALIGMVNWTTYWFVEGRRDHAPDIANQIAEMAVQSLLVEGGRRRRKSSAKGALEVLREDLDHLAKLIENER